MVMGSGSVNIRLRSIEELSFNRSEHNFDVDIIAFSFYTQAIIDIAAEEIKVVGGMKYRYNGAELLTLECQSLFEVDGLSDIIDVVGEKVDFKVDIIPMLLTTTIGAMRGIATEKNRGSELDKIPFPLISMNLLLTNNTVTVE